MRLAFVVSSRIPSSAAHSVAIAKSCEALAGLGLEVELWHSPSRERPGEGVSAFHGLDPSFTERVLPERSFGGPYARMRGAARVAEELRTLRHRRDAARLGASGDADLYLTRHAPIAAGLATTGRPTALEVHAAVRPAALRCVLRGARRGSLRAALALTEPSANALVESGLPRSLVHVVPSGVDLRPFAGLPDRAAARAQLGLPAGPLVGYVGRLRSEKVADKGVGQIVEAVAQARARVPDARLLCVGGPLAAEPDLRATAAAAGLPDRALLVEDRLPAALVAVAIRACDVLIVPTAMTDFGLRFTSPLKLFEYLAAGAAIVAADIAGVREIVGADDCVAVVPPGDVRACGEAVADLLSDPARAASLGARGPAIAARHSWDTRARRVLDALGS